MGIDLIHQLRVFLLMDEEGDAEVTVQEHGTFMGEFTRRDMNDGALARRAAELKKSFDVIVLSIRPSKMSPIE